MSVFIVLNFGAFPSSTKTLVLYWIYVDCPT